MFWLEQERETVGLNSGLTDRLRLALTETKNRWETKNVNKSLIVLIFTLFTTFLLNSNPFVPNIYTYKRIGFFSFAKDFYVFVFYCFSSNRALSSSRIKYTLFLIFLLLYAQYNTYVHFLAIKN